MDPAAPGWAQTPNCTSILLFLQCIYKHVSLLAAAAHSRQRFKAEDTMRLRQF
ncbi:MAG: hypothetical protein WA633_12915 [Stellaceae bacterium]